MNITIHINQFVYVKGNQQLIGEPRQLPRGWAYSIANVTEYSVKEIQTEQDLSYFEVKLTCRNKEQKLDLYIAICASQWERSLEPELRHNSQTNSDCSCMLSRCERAEEIARHIIDDDTNIWPNKGKIYS